MSEAALARVLRISKQAGYTNRGDRDINTLWTALCQEKPVIKQHWR